MLGVRGRFVARRLWRSPQGDSDVPPRPRKVVGVAEGFRVVSSCRHEVSWAVESRATSRPQIAVPVNSPRPDHRSTGHPVSRSFLRFPVFPSADGSPPRSTFPPTPLRRLSLLFLLCRTPCSGFTRRRATSSPKSDSGTHAPTGRNEELIYGYRSPRCHEATMTNLGETSPRFRLSVVCPAEALAGYVEFLFRFVFAQTFSRDITISNEHRGNAEKN